MTVEFINKIKDGAIRGWTEGKILPSITLAQGILESDRGKSELARNANNLFGIKAKDDWKGKSYTVRTAEYDKYNNKFYINAPFRVYSNWDESVIDHARFFHTPDSRKQRYKNVIGETDYKKAAQALQDAGYATSQKYASQLIELIERYKLYEYDKDITKTKKGNDSMRILLTVGHSILKSGGTTSAVGIKHEYNYNKALAPYVKRELEKLGHICDIVVCPERQFTSWRQERGYKLPIANSGRYDIVGELHLNASNGAGHGMECLYYPGDQRGLAIANRACKAFQDLGFKNRGAKARGDLYIIAATKPLAVLFESFFCDNKNDCDLADRVGFEKIAKAICMGLVGKVATTSGNTKVTEKPKDTHSANKKNIVIYKGEGDKDCARILAHHFNCEMILDDGAVNTPKYGGKDKYNIKYVGEGKNRAESAKIALNRYI